MIFVGDLHGNWGHLKWAIKQKQLKDENIIQVGDFGVGFSSYEHDMEKLQQLNDFLKEKNITLYVWRGNHDNPYFFDGTVNMTNLKLLPDYTLTIIEGKGVLGVGGATSIDRRPRIVENEANIRYGNDSFACGLSGDV